MIKVLIADDEKYIREGLAEYIDWEGLGVVLVGKAQNGEEALEIVKAERPDICLIDIMMPVINGLDFIEIVRSIDPKITCIIVTSCDDFASAHRALKLGALDYILKPIYEDELNIILKKAIRKIRTERESESKLNKIRTQLYETLPSAKTQIVQKCLYKECSPEDILKFEDTYKCRFHNQIGVLAVPLFECSYVGEEQHRLKEAELLGRICNYSERLFPPKNAVLLTTIEKFGAVAIVEINDLFEFEKTSEALRQMILDTLYYRVHVYIETTDQTICEIGNLLDKIETLSKQNNKYTPILREIKEYVDLNFRDSTLTLKMLVARFNITAGYISRLFKNELGISFSDYIEQKRLDLALTMLKENHYKVYEIAEKVGYSSQHYFCTVFKKVMGCTPSDYIRRFSNEAEKEE